jgi:ABC-type antimicrobial peptide transport system permease subunit
MLHEKWVCVGIFRGPGYLAGETWTTRAAILADAGRQALGVVYLELPTKADAQALIENFRNDRGAAISAVTQAELLAKLAGNHTHLIKAMIAVFLLVVLGAVLAASSLLSLVQQRRLPELCTLRAIGFRSRAVGFLIFWETEIIAFLGGGLGVAVAIIGLKNYAIHSSGKDGTSFTFSAALDWNQGCAAFALMLMVGMIGAIAPIIVTRRTQITRGLREE